MRDATAAALALAWATKCIKAIPVPADGPAGPAGPAGANGADGAPGPRGPQGIGFTMVGPYQEGMVYYGPSDDQPYYPVVTHAGSSYAALDPSGVSGRPPGSGWGLLAAKGAKGDRGGGGGGGSGGGAIDGTTIGATSASTGAFTTLSATGAITGSTTITVGGGSSQRYGVINGGNSASGDGALWLVQNSGTSVIGIGNRSAWFGGTYDALAGLFSQDDIGLFAHNSEKARLTSSGMTVTGSFGTTGAASFGTGQTDYIVAQGAGGTARIDATGSTANNNLAMSVQGTGSFYWWGNGYGSTELARLNTTGLGIGTAPSAKLHVAGGRSYFTGNNEAYAVYLQYNGSTQGVFIGSPEQDVFGIYSAGGGEHLRVDTNGNLLVGTTSNTEGAKLKSRRTSGTTAPIFSAEAAVGSFTGASIEARNTLTASSTYDLFRGIVDSDADAGGPTTVFKVDGTGAVTASTATLSGDTGAGWVATVTSTNGTNNGRVLLGSRAAATGAVQGATNAGAIAALLLNPDGGNVGIGTTAPASKLDVAGTLRSTATTVPASGVGAEMYYLSGTGYFLTYNRGTSAWAPTYVGGSVIALATDGAEQVRITSTAGANRFISMTGSNGGNPTISTSGGDLAVGTNLSVTGNLYFTGTKSHWMGEVYVTDNATATTIANTTDFVKVAGTTTIQNNMGFDSGSASNRLRYTGTTTRMFHVASSFSLSTAGTNQTVQIAVFKNGVQVTGSLMELRAGTSGEVVSSAMHSVVSLATNDYIEVFVRNATSTSAVTVKHLNFFAMNAN